MLTLAIDTCGPTGSVALARIMEASDSGSAAIELLSQRELAGRSYSTTLTTAVDELLSEAQFSMAQIQAMVIVNGPGSFTGVRVGLSTVKGLAEPMQTPVATVSRLAVLAHKACTRFAALDAHRGEVFLQIEAKEQGDGIREILAGKDELAMLAQPTDTIAVCDECAGVMLKASWPDVKLTRVPAPSAYDALQLAGTQVLTANFVNLVLLDGHYLRRSDAEIFGEKAAAVPGQQ